MPKSKFQVNVSTAEIFFNGLWFIMFLNLNWVTILIFNFCVEMLVNWQIIKWKKLIVKYWCFSLEHCVNCQSHRSICESECTAIDSSILKVKQTKWFPSSKWEMIAVELHLHPRVMCQVTKRVLPSYRIVIWYWSHSTSSKGNFSVKIHKMWLYHGTLDMGTLQMLICHTKVIILLVR